MGALHASGGSWCGALHTAHPGSTSRRLNRMAVRAWALLCAVAMPFLACLLTAAVWPSLAQAQTPVSGAISANTRWTLAGSPYVVNDNLYIQGGATLTIDPGVVVSMGNAVRLQVVSGAVIALGTASQPMFCWRAEAAVDVQAPRVP